MYLVRRSRKSTVNEISGCDYPVDVTTPVCPSVAKLLNTFTVISGYLSNICRSLSTNVTNIYLRNIINQSSRGIKHCAASKPEVLRWLLNVFQEGNRASLITLRPAKTIYVSI